MIFPAMMFLLGFVCAALLAWLIVPPLVRSASRNARKKQKIPKGIKQALADKDRLRAEFALSLCKAEHRIEKLKSRAHDQLVEIAARDARIGALKKEMGKITDLADRRFQDREKLRHNLETVKIAKQDQPRPSEADTPAKDNVHALEPRQINLPEVSQTAQSARIEPVLKGSLTSRVHKIKNPE